MNNTRWWESYLVRYLSGSIVGSISLICLVYNIHEAYYPELINKLLISFTLENKIDWKYFPTLFIGLTILILGLLYSYLISSPITVIHYARGGTAKIEKIVRYIWLGWAQLLLSQILFKENTFTALVLNFLVSLIFCGLLYNKSERNSFFEIYLKSTLSSVAIFAICKLIFKISGVEESNYLSMSLYIGFPTISVGVMQYVTLFRVLKSEDEIHKFYENLVNARIHSKSKEIRETYTHLREHSNSSFIVIVVVCFTSFLIFLNEMAQKIESQIESPAEKAFSYFLSILIIWLIPNLFMWSRANNLEKKFSENPKSYLGKYDDPDTVENKSFNEKNIEEEIVNGDKVKVTVTHKEYSETVEKKENIR